MALAFEPSDCFDLFALQIVCDDESCEVFDHASSMISSILFDTQIVKAVGRDDWLSIFVSLPNVLVVHHSRSAADHPPLVFPRTPNIALASGFFKFGFHHTASIYFSLMAM
jgi:hypothetical protein